MIGGVFQNILGGKSKSIEAQTGNDVSLSPLALLEDYQQGLSIRVDRYLTDGREPEVLGDLKNAVAKRPANRVFYKLLNEIRSMAHGCGGQPARLSRLVYVHKALGAPDAHKNETEPHRTRVSSDAARLLALFLDRRVPKDVLEPTTSNDVIAALGCLGGSEVDFVSFLLPTSRDVPPLAVPDISEALGDKPAYLDRVPTDVLIAALDRCDVKTRTRALCEFQLSAVGSSLEFLEFLFCQFDETSEKLRDAARMGVLRFDPDAVEALALPRLSAGNATLRRRMVQILGDLGTPSAVQALKKHRDVETAQSVLDAIETYLEGPVREEDMVEEGYLDAYGREVHFPEGFALVDDGSHPLFEEHLSELIRLEDGLNHAEQKRYQKAHSSWLSNGQQGACPEKPSHVEFAHALFDALNNPVDTQEFGFHKFLPTRYRDAVDQVIEGVIDRLPLKRIVDLACAESEGLIDLLHRDETALATFIQSELRRETLRLGQVIEAAEAIGLGMQKSDPANMTSYAQQYLAVLLDTELQEHEFSFEFYPSFWEIAAPYLGDIVDGLPPRSSDASKNLIALEMAGSFPVLPKALLKPVLWAAVDDRPQIQKQAQVLLDHAPGVNELLVELLDDIRQAVRANAVRLLAGRAAHEALSDIEKRLKKEKSEQPRAEMISAIAVLGGDTAPFLGIKALEREAENLIEKLPDSKIDWLDITSAPELRWANGTSVSPKVAEGWLRLALKLKAPKGSPLFTLYGAQLTPESRAAFSDWVLESWIAYDTEAPDQDGLIEQAERMADETLATPANWMVHVGYTRGEIIAAHMQSLTSTYINSGLDSKGVLALTHWAKPETSVSAIATYLKLHGRRVSQAKALLEVLYGMGTKEAVRKLVETATRSKQLSLREHARQLVKELAEARGWNEEVLADRSVSSCGFDDEGSLPLPVGDDGKLYLARLTADLDVELLNPLGKVVKALPAGKDETTRSSRIALSEAKKSLNFVKVEERARLYEAMLAQRVWSFEAWVSDLATHPVLKRLTERLVWRGLDEDGDFVAGLRLTSNGQILNAEGNDLDLARIASLDLAHSSNLPEGVATAWNQHLTHFEIEPLFPQISRPILRVGEQQWRSKRLDDREDWLITASQLHETATHFGYRPGPCDDDGVFSSYVKAFKSTGIVAELRFSGCYAGDEDEQVAIGFLQFVSPSKFGKHKVLPLESVPPLLVSEAWNDMHDVAGAGVYDPGYKVLGAE